MDEETCKLVDNIVHLCFNTWTVISVEGRVDHVLNFDKVAMLDKGKLVEFDSPRTLLGRESLFRDFYSASVQHQP
jgi:ABC-type multidrug transport system fused ATPase/permease subunit